MPDSTISSLPPASPVTPADLIPCVQSGVTKVFTAQQLLAAANAASLQVADYAALRNVTANILSVYVTGYLASAAPSGIAGLFVRDDSDITTADNGGTVIVSSNGKRWKRVFLWAISPRWFGAAGDGVADDTSAIQATINYASSLSNQGYVHLPAGKYKITSFLSVPYGVSIRGDGAVSSQLLCYDCDGLHFTTYGYQIGSMFYEDFGLTASSGTNRTAISTPSNASTMDGLYLNRLRFYGWNECVDFAANWNCSIERCAAQNVNVFVAASGTIVGLRLVNNRAVFASGGAGTVAKVAVDVRGGSIQESIHLINNYLYGFDYCFKANTNTLFVNILNNDLSAVVTAISYNTVNGVFNVKDNYIETKGGGVAGAALGAQTPTTQTNIEGNAFVGITTATIGLQLNTAVGTNQFNTNIADNVFSGFATYDMQLYSPGRTFVLRNRFMSSAPTNSVWVGQVSAGPVKLEDNWLNKALYTDVATDITSGLLVLIRNTVANTFAPYSGAFIPTFTSQSGAFGSITYGANSGTFERNGNIVTFTLSIYTTAVTLGTAGGQLYISGLPFMSRGSLRFACAVSDVRLWATGKGPSAGEVALNDTRISLYNRATSNGDSALLNATDLTNTNPGNILTLSGTYICS